MKTDLLVVTPVSTVGGSERVAFQIAKHIKALGHTVQALTKEPVQAKEMLTWYHRAHIPIGTSPYIKPLSPAKVLTSMLGLARKVKSFGPPHSVNLHNPGNTILFSDVRAFKMAGVENIVCSIHHPLDPATLPKSWIKSTLMAAKMADWVVVTTPALEANAMELGIPESKLKMIPLGIEAGEHETDKATARNQLKVPKDAFVVGTLCRLVRDKRVDQVIRGCAQSKAFMQRGFLLVGGDGEEKAKLQSMAQDFLPGRHKFLGRIEDTAKFYAAIDAFVLVSELEGFGLVYVEAGSFGVPSIGCDTGGTRYAIHDGDTGFLVPVNEPAAFVPKLEIFMQDPDVAAILGQRARKFAEENYSIKKMARAYEEALGLKPASRR